jgi:hypothetical protein
VIKFNCQIKRASAYFVLICYLIITITNTLHFHKIDLAKSSSIINPLDNKQIFHLYFNGSVNFCPIQSAYSALQNTIISFSNPYQNYLKKIDIIDIPLISCGKSKASILNYSLRAPPKFS